MVDAAQAGDQRGAKRVADVLPRALDLLRELDELEISIAPSDEGEPADGDGLEVVSRVQALRPALPALVVTGNTLPTELARLAASGVAVLNKPFRAEALLAALQSLAPRSV